MPAFQPLDYPALAMIASPDPFLTQDGLILAVLAIVGALSLLFVVLGWLANLLGWLAVALDPTLADHQDDAP